MKRFVTSSTLGMLALLIFAMPTTAGRAWCMRDPIVEIDGHIVQIWVAIPEEFEKYANAPIDVTIRTSKADQKKVLFTDAGFNGHGERVTWGKDLKDDNDGLLKVNVNVKVKLDHKKIDKDFGKDTDLPVQVTVITEAGTEIVYGTAKTTDFTLNLAIPDDDDNDEEDDDDDD